MIPELNRIYQGNCIEIMRGWPDGFIHMCVTSPPYWGLRDYGVDGQLGLETTPQEYIAKMVDVFHEVRRVMRDDGTLWLNVGDSYASNMKGSGGPSSKQDSNAGSRYKSRRLSHGVKEKDLVGIPWMLAFALRSDGWYLRQDLIWHKPNPMPESVTDRCTKAHEYIFLLAKSDKYYYDQEAIKEPSIYFGLDPRSGQGNIRYMDGKRNGSSGDGQEAFVTINEMRNRRSVWTVTTKSCREAHFATFPEDLILPCILAGSPRGGVVLDPFMGAGTTALVAMKDGRQFVGCELNPKYIEIAQARIAAEQAQGKLF